MKSHSLLIMIFGLILARAVAAQMPPSESEHHRRMPRAEAMPGSRSREGSEIGLMHRWLQRPETLAQLEIDEPQARMIRERLQETAREMVTLRTALEQSAVRQAELMSRTPIDEAAVMAAIEELGLIRTRIDQLRARELIFMQGALTDAQRARAVEMVNARKQEWEQRGREGEPPPGAGSRQRESRRLAR